MERIRRFSFVLCLFGCVSFVLCLAGCDRPEHDVEYYGTILTELPKIPEAEKKYDIPEIEGVDKEEIMSGRYMR